MKQDKKVVGVWLDHQNAMLITTPNHDGHGEYEVIEKIHAAHHGDHGGNEHTHNQMNHGLLEKFYKEVTSEISTYDEIFIFGPGKAQEQLFNHLKGDKHFESKNLSIDSAGNLTDHQMIAMVRDFFKPLVSA